MLDSVSWVLCNDCEQKSFAKHHFLYHKCVCGSYNTRVLKTYEKAEDAKMEAEAVGEVEAEAEAVDEVPPRLDSTEST